MGVNRLPAEDCSEDSVIIEALRSTYGDEPLLEFDPAIRWEFALTEDDQKAIAKIAIPKSRTVSCVASSARSWITRGAAAAAVVVALVYVGNGVASPGPKSPPGDRVRGIDRPAIANTLLFSPGRFNVLDFLEKGRHLSYGGSNEFSCKVSDDETCRVLGDGYLLTKAIVKGPYVASFDFRFEKGMGFALAVNAQPVDTASDVDCLCVNFDVHDRVVQIKRMRDDKTLMKLWPIGDHELNGWHRLTLRHNGDGRFEAELDNHQAVKFHYFNFDAGQIGFRIWGDSSVSIKNFDLHVRPTSDNYVHPGKGRVDYLIAAVSDFYKLDDLPGVAKDAAKVLTAIATQDKSTGAVGWDFRGEDVTQENLKHVLTYRYQDRSQDDVLLVYLASHGAHLGRGRYLLCTSRTATSSSFSFQESTIDVNSLVNATALSDHGLVLLVIDACSTGISGASSDLGQEFTPELADWLANESQKRNAIVLAASGDTAIESDAGGAFTRAFVQGLRSGADANRDKKITVGELVRYLQEEVPESTDGRQLPVVSSNYKDFADIILVRL